jgi:hypothetical protein
MKTPQLSPGQLLLWRASPHPDFFARLIVWAEHAPYIHASIVVERQHQIEATNRGIQITRVTMSEVIQNADIVEVAQYTESADSIDFALSWAKTKVGLHYGYADIVYQAVKFLWPNNPLRIGVKNEWDCSDFATRYLLQAGVHLPEDFQDPYSMSPNDLGRLFGLQAPRKGHEQGIPLVPVHGVTQKSEVH